MRYLGGIHICIRNAGMSGDAHVVPLNNHCLVYMSWITSTQWDQGSDSI